MYSQICYDMASYGMVVAATNFVKFLLVDVVGCVRVAVGVGGLWSALMVVLRRLSLLVVLFFADGCIEVGGYHLMWCVRRVLCCARA